MKRFLKNLGAALQWCFGFADAAAESLVADDNDLVNRQRECHKIDAIVAEFTVSEPHERFRNRVDGPPFENGKFTPFEKPKRKVAKKSAKKSTAAPKRKKAVKKKSPAKPAARKKSPRR
jgi:hypothetical protein